MDQGILVSEPEESTDEVVLGLLRQAGVPSFDVYRALDVESDRPVLLVGIDPESSRRDIYGRLASVLAENDSTQLLQDLYLVSRNDQGMQELRSFARAVPRNHEVVVGGRGVRVDRRLSSPARELENAVAEALAGASELRLVQGRFSDASRADFVAESSAGIFVIECKALGYPAPVSAVLSLAGYVHLLQSRERRSVGGVLVTTGPVSAAAATLIRESVDLATLDWLQADAAEKLRYMVMTGELSAGRV